MKRLFEFLFKRSYTLLFLLLFLINFFIIVSYNNYHRSFYFNTSNYLMAKITERFLGFNSYLALREKNNFLSRQNQHLLSSLANNFTTASNSFTTKDTSNNQVISYKRAKVISNSVDKLNNYITIDKGSVDNIEKGMGVITPLGVIGIVVNVSKHYSLIQSLLSNRLRVSASLLPSKALGAITWNKNNIKQISLLEIPYHVKVNVGDTVLTSGYSTIYPSEILIGTVNKVDLKPESNFYTITVDLIQDFYALDYVFVVKYLYKSEINELKLGY